MSRKKPILTKRMKEELEKWSKVPPHLLGPTQYFWYTPSFAGDLFFVSKGNSTPRWVAKGLPIREHDRAPIEKRRPAPVDKVEEFIDLLDKLDG